MSSSNYTVNLLESQLAKLKGGSRFERNLSSIDEDIELLRQRVFDLQKERLSVVEDIADLEEKLAQLKG